MNPNIKCIAVPVYILVPVSDEMLAKDEYFDHITTIIDSMQRVTAKQIICPEPGELGDWEFGTRQELEEKLWP